MLGKSRESPGGREGAGGVPMASKFMGLREKR